MRIPHELFQRLELQVHSILKDVPLSDVTMVDLPGGGPGRTISDVRALIGGGKWIAANRIVRFLFALRSLLGKIFSWDNQEPSAPARNEHRKALNPVSSDIESPFGRTGTVPESTLARAQGTSYLDRVSGDIKSRSVLTPGSKDGSFRLLYILEKESLAEIRNATVHGFLSSALIENPSGYRLYIAVYVKPVSWLTPIYMFLIEPFRRFIVYPAMVRGIRKAWEERYPRYVST